MLTNRTKGPQATRRRVHKQRMLRSEALIIEGNLPLRAPPGSGGSLMPKQEKKKETKIATLEVSNEARKSYNVKGGGGGSLTKR